MRASQKRTRCACSVDKELLAIDLGSFRNADSGQALIGKAEHSAASQAKKMRMATRAASVLRLVENVAKRSVDSLHAMNQMGLLKILEGTEHGHAVESEKKIDYFAMRESSTGS